MRINYNASAYQSAGCLKRNENALSKSIKRLSSGLKINEAKDDPSAYAIAKRMKLQIRGVSNASDNAETGKNIIQTADGALSEIHSILQRINELSVQASNGIISDTDRKSVDAEVQELKNEIDRISKATDFNGQSLLDGQFDLKGYTTNNDVKVKTYTDSVKSGIYTVNNITITPGLDADGNTVYNITDLDLQKTDGGFEDPSMYEASYNKNTNSVTITGKEGFSIELSLNEKVNELDPNDPNTQEYQTGAFDINIMNIGAMNVQIGANKGQLLQMKIPSVSLSGIGLENLNTLTSEDALDSLRRIDDAINYISEVRGRLGAYQNRLEHSENSLNTTEENMTSSYSLIMDLDMAEEMTEYTSKQVLTEAGTSMVAQANQRPQQVLQLLQ